MRRALSLAAAAAVVAAPLTVTGPARATPGYTSSYVTIPGYGGTPLKAFVVTPTGRGNGPFPVLVMPGSWALGDAEYVGAATKLATAYGFETISYTTRGFWDSGSTIDVAGRQDTGDASKVIDWAVARGNADVHRVGMAGISYGAGISLLTAARDKRVRAAAAMSAWADLGASIYPHGTLSEQTAALLLFSGDLLGRPGADLQRLQQAYFTNQINSVLPLAVPRSAATYLEQLNANRPAILIGNPWQDGIFPPDQITDFYNRLTVPKRLMLEPGDHGTTSLTGAIALPSDVWTAAGRWFDHYLRGTKNGIERERPIQAKASNGGGWQGFASWQALSPRTRGYGWRGSKKIATGVGTVADSGFVELTGAEQQFGVATTARIAAVDRRYGAVWSTPSLTKTTMLSGFPWVRLKVTPTARDTSLFAYLYDVGPSGVGSLMTHEPYSLRGAVPGRTYSLNLRLWPDRWKIAAGHHIALVIDTMDLRYRSASAQGGQLTLAAPSITIPTAG